MSKQFIQFASVLFMLAALLAVSAQENTTALNNATMNNTTLLNNTANETALNETVSAENESAPAASEIIPVQNETAPAQIEVIAAQNETAPAQNITLSENVTAVAEPITTSPVSQPGAMQIGSPQRTVYAIGGSERSPNLFSIDGKALAQGAYEVGLPAKTIMDLSALPFFVNKI